MGVADRDNTRRGNRKPGGTEGQRAQQDTYAHCLPRRRAPAKHEGRDKLGQTMSLTSSIFGDDAGGNEETNSLFSASIQESNHRRGKAKPTNRKRKPSQALSASTIAGPLLTASTGLPSYHNDADAVRRTIERRRRRSNEPIIEELDFPSALEKSGELPADERANETSYAVRQHGLCVFRNVFEPCTMKLVAKEAREVQSRLYAALSSRGIDKNEIFRFREAASRCSGRTDVIFELTRDGGPLGLSQKIIRNETVYPVVQNLLGAEDDDGVKLVYAGLIFNSPGSNDQPFHQDGVPLFPELPGAKSTEIQANMPPYAVNLFIPLEDSDGDVWRGPTEFIPGSHKWPEPDRQLERVLGGKCSDHKIVSPRLMCGDAVLYDYRVCHRGTSNLSGKYGVCKSEDKQQSKRHKKRGTAREKKACRRILYLMYARPWYDDHVNFDYTKSAESLFENT